MSIAARRFSRTQRTPVPPVLGVTFNPGALPIGTASYAAPGDAVWVAKTGNDTTGTGASGAPYLTIKKALSVAPVDATVVVRAGIYHEGGPQYSAVGVSGLGGQMTFANTGVTLQNAPGEAVWVDGSTDISSWTSDAISVPGKTVWRTSFSLIVNRAPTDQRGQTVSGYGSFLVAEYPIAHWCEMVLYDGTQLTQVQNLSELGPGKFYVVGSFPSGGITNDYRSTEYIIGDDPNGHEVRIADLSRALGIGRNNTTIRGIGFRNYNTSLCDWGMMSVSTSITNLNFENVIVQDISTMAGAASGSNSVTRYCTFQRCGQTGWGGDSDNGLVEHCIFRQNNYKVFNYGPNAGQKWGRCDGMTIRYNLFDEVRGHALWVDECGVNFKIHGNVMYRPWGHGVSYEISDSGWIVDNILIGCGVDSPVATRPPYDGVAIWISGSNRTHAWHNTFVNCEVPLRFAQDSRDPDTSTFGQDPSHPDLQWYLDNCSWNITDGKWSNNAFIWSTGLNAVQASFVSNSNDISGAKATLNGTALQAAGNLYVRKDASHPTRFGIGYPNTAGGVKVYASMTSTGVGLYDPTVSWKDEYNETGSALTTNASPWANGTVYQIASSLTSLTTPAAVPSEVQALLDVSPFNAQPVGAGYMDT